MASAEGHDGVFQPQEPGLLQHPRKRRVLGLAEQWGTGRSGHSGRSVEEEARAQLSTRGSGTGRLGRARL